VALLTGGSLAIFECAVAVGSRATRTSTMANASTTLSVLRIARSPRSSYPRVQCRVGVGGSLRNVQGEPLWFG